MKSLALLLLLLAAGFAGQAEPLTPLLSKTAVDSIRALLRTRPPDAARVPLLLQLGEDFFLKSNGEMCAALDTAARYINQAAALSNTLGLVDGQIKARYLVGRIRFARGEKLAGEALIRAALTQAQQQGRRQLEAFGWYTLSHVYPRTAVGLPTVIYCCQQARIQYKQLGDKRAEAYMLKLTANMHLLQGNAAQALQELEEALGLYRAIGYQKLHYTYDLLLSAHRQMGNYREAMRYGIASVESAKATRDTSAINVFYWRLGQLCSELNQTRQAIAYYAQALAYAQQLHDVTSIVDDAGEISRLLIKQKKPTEALRFFTKALRDNRSAIDSYPDFKDLRMAITIHLGECYLALNALPQAQHCYRQLIEMLEQNFGDDIEKMFICQSVGEFYLRTRHYSEARHYLTKALLLHSRGGYLLGVADVHLLLFKADSGQANFPAAIAHYQRYKALTDSISTEARNNQVASLQIQYDTKKKERNIALLTNLSRLQQGSMRQWEFQRNAFLAGALMLALLLGLGYSRFRLKQRSNQLLESQQLEIKAQNISLEELLRVQRVLLTEKEWMLREIHHRVKNNLQIITSLLNSQFDFLRDPAALVAVQQSQNRVHAMALIHQKLYQSDNLAGVNMPEYITDIVAHLIGSYNRQGQVQPRLSIIAVSLDVALATPLGLIINEAVTNSLKYAFPPDRQGSISIELLPGQAADRYILMIADNGVGMPESWYRKAEGAADEDAEDAEDVSTLGLTIIKGLSRQIGAGLTFGSTRSNGVQISLQFAGVSRFTHPLSPLPEEAAPRP